MATEHVQTPLDGWEEAYTARFSGAAGSKGNRPIVVSYASSPPAEAPKPTTGHSLDVLLSGSRAGELAGRTGPVFV